MDTFKFKSVLFLLILMPAFLTLANGAKILTVYSTPSKSHLIFAQNFLKHLAKLGHEVTVVSPFPLDKPLANYNEVLLQIPESFKIIMAEMSLNPPSGLQFMLRVSQFQDNAFGFANSSINTPEFKKLMNEQSFDLVILPVFMNEFQTGLAAHFKCPLVIISPVGNLQMVTSVVGNPRSVATTPNLFLNYKTPMTFLQRVINFGVSILETAMMQVMIFKAEKYYNYNFPPGQYPTFSEARSNVALLLANHHFSEGAMRPTVPSLVDVGGLQTKEKPDPLPENIQKWIDGAEHGVILFSFGSNVKSSALSQEKIQIILNAFSKVKQRVLFKWESDDLPLKFNNVLTSKWIPQDDVLAHKNVKLFITHGGLGSVVEAKFHGVPIVGIPFFGDQTANVATAVEEGWGLNVDFADISEDKLTTAINEILTNPKYFNKVQSISKLYRDRPMSALDTATYWVEYVIRHKGAPHMRFPGADMNFIQSNSLDVIAFFAVVLYLVCKLTSLLGKCAWRLVKSKLCANSNKKQSNKKLKKK